MLTMIPIHINCMQGSKGLHTYSKLRPKCTCTIHVSFLLSVCPFVSDCLIIRRSFRQIACLATIVCPTMCPSIPMDRTKVDLSGQSGGVQHLHVLRSSYIFLHVHEWICHFYRKSITKKSIAMQSEVSQCTSKTLQAVAK
jgi:hypothetical protein